MFRFKNKQKAIFIQPKPLQKCYTCFSRDHDTIKCKDKAPKLFIPQIDRDLLPRFYQLFDLWEKYLLQFSSPSITVIPDLKKIYVSEEDGLNYGRGDPYEKLKNIPVILSSSFWINDLNIKLSPPLHKVVASRVQNIFLRHSSIDKRDLFFLISSKKIKIFKCIKVAIFQKVTFAEIMPYLPNAELIVLYETNIEVEDAWLDEILKHKNRKNLEHLSLDIKSINFDCDKLINVIRKKCVKNVEISLGIDIQNNVTENQKALTAKLKEYFFETECSEDGGIEFYFITYEDAHTDNGIQIQRKLNYHKTFALRNVMSRSIRKLLN